MNIGQMMRGLLGDVTSGETRAMELKTGQVVRGVVLQALDNNEAIVSINGVHVRAKLEMALQPGQSAMLQVQPESNGSIVLLKAVDLNNSGLLDDTFREIAKQLGLPDQKWALALIRNLRQEGFAFNRTTALAFQQAAAAMPKGADNEQWMTAAATAFKRGMPMTAATIASLQQVMFGKPAHELLDQLQRQLTAMGTASSAGGAAEDGMPQTASRVLALLQQGSALFGEALARAEAVPGKAGGSTGHGAAVANSEGAIGGGKPTAETAPTVGGEGGRAMTSDSAIQARQGQAPTTGNWLGQMMKWMGVDHELQLAKAATDGGTSPAGQSAPSETGEAEGRAAVGRTPAGLTGDSLTGNARNAGNAQSAASVSLQQGTTQASTPVSAQPATASLGQQEGGAEAVGRAPVSDQRPDGATASIRSEGQAAAAVSRMAGLLAGDGPASGENPPTSPSQGGAGTPSGGMGAESLKSALMSLAGGADIPPHVKETAQQLIGQITGQQLLLAPERNNSVFTHVTMFIPLKDESGEQTASVQIQTRRGRKGELDADNCRLLFNLSMKSLGDTLVDVQITDKIVSLQLWNDHPSIAGLVESSREELSASLAGVGYQLLSMRTKPLPQNDAQSSNDSNAAAGSAQNKQPSASSSPWLTATRYKGVDYRA